MKQNYCHGKKNNKDYSGKLPGEKFDEVPSTAPCTEPLLFYDPTVEIMSTKKHKTPHTIQDAALLLLCLPLRESFGTNSLVNRINSTVHTILSSLESCEGSTVFEKGPQISRKLCG